jgi:hypothetical protein
MAGDGIELTFATGTPRSGGIVEMVRKSRVYRVMIGSPADLGEERQAATDAINEWNAQHSDAKEIVLLPVKWETHALPTSGVRPQAAINEQLVDRCDILVGMFWTRLGTRTGIAASGTVEEIDRFVSAGKPAMLYFSRREVTKTTLEPKQATKLRKFKAATHKKSLVGSFDSVADLKRVLLRDLTRQVRMLQPGSRIKEVTLTRGVFHGAFARAGEGVDIPKLPKPTPQCHCKGA